MSRFRSSLTRVRVAAAGVGVLGALAVAVPATANAAGPVMLAPYGDSVTFPTWVFGSTKVCATNLGPLSGGINTYNYARVDPLPTFDGTFDQVYVPKNGTGCTTGNWWGDSVQVTNVGSTVLRVQSY
jgi:hypothetical protein